MTDLPSSAALHARLQAVFSPTFLEVQDDSAAHAGHSGANGLGHGTHFKVVIAAPAFAGLGRVQAHRLVYDALSPFMQAGLHALALEIKR